MKSFLLSFSSIPQSHSRRVVVSRKIKKKCGYSKTRLKRLLKNRQNRGANDKWYLNEGQKYCRMLPLEHSAIFLTCIKRKLVLKTKFLVFFLSGRFRQVLLYLGVSSWNICFTFCDLVCFCLSSGAADSPPPFCLGTAADDRCGRSASL